MFTWLHHQYPAVAHVLTQPVNLAFGLRKYISGSLGFRLQAVHKARSQLYGTSKRLALGDPLQGQHNQLVFSDLTKII